MEGLQQQAMVSRYPFKDSHSFRWP